MHGAWHGPWCWDRLRSELDDVDVRTVAQPGTGPDPDVLGDLYDDAAAVRSTVAAIDGPVVVCAHSYGGSPASEGVAGVTNVRRLVFVAACVPEIGESVLDLAGNEWPPVWEVHESRGYADVRDPLATLYQDVDPAIAESAAVRLRHQSLTSLTQPNRQAGWHDVPSSYLVLEEDATFPVPLQELLAGRVGSSRRLDSGHSPFFSRPAELARLLREELDQASTRELDQASTRELDQASGPDSTGR
ncbi:alpha/beta hydrolase [Micromonospora sp. NPDC050397]|uniref:alpha/beta hydrolase n=1 Tax=Micromonospora sp. NPDC050397 TaxID=3364279 RepID=UPI0038511734